MVRHHGHRLPRASLQHTNVRSNRGSQIDSSASPTDETIQTNDNNQQSTTQDHEFAGFDVQSTLTNEFPSLKVVDSSKKPCKNYVTILAYPEATAERVVLSSHNILILRISTLNLIALSLIPLFRRMPIVVLSDSVSNPHPVVGCRLIIE